MRHKTRLPQAGRTGIRRSLDRGTALSAAVERDVDVSSACS